MKQIDNQRIERFFFLIFIFLFVLNMNIIAQSFKVNIGSDTILLPPNIGSFSEIHDIDPNAMKNIADNFTPPQNELLGLYLSESDLGLILKGEQPAYKRYIMVQIMKAIKDKKIDRTQFADFEKAFEENLDKSLSSSDKETVSLFKNQSDKLATKENIALKMELGKMISLGTFVKNEKYTVSSFLSKTLMEIDGKKTDYIQCGGISLININNKVIFVYIYSNYDNITDLDWVRNLSKDLCDRIIQLNPQPEKASIKSQDSFIIYIIKKEWSKLLILILLIIGISIFRTIKRNNENSKPV